MKRYSSYIDVHHHYNPLSMLDLPKNIRRKILKEEGGSMDISRNLDAMEKLGIEKSILSYPAWFPALTEQESLVFCTQVNECYANLISEHSCLGAFALLPVSQNHELVLGAMEYALDTLQLEGIVLSTSMQGGLYVAGLVSTCFRNWMIAMVWFSFIRHYHVRTTKK